jgi:hypothetical protein
MSNKRVKSLDYDDDYYDYGDDGDYDYEGQPEGGGYGTSEFTPQVPQRLSAEDERKMAEGTRLVRAEIDGLYDKGVHEVWIREALWESYWDVQGAVGWLKGRRI